METIFASVVGELVKPVAGKFGNWFSHRQKLKEVLGEWMDEAHANSKRCMLPILERERFEAHLKKFNGAFEPSGVCLANARWAYLLHALGIRPGMGVLSWKPPVESSDDSEKVSISLEMTGAMLSHIFNLYRIDTLSNNWESPEAVGRNPIRCSMPFGKLSFEGGKKDVTAIFNPGPVDRINEVKVPLGKAGVRLHDAHPETLISTYFDTLNYGVSDPNLRWPKSSSQLIQRVHKLLEVIGSGLGWGCLLAETPLLLTHEWLEMASRIRRRVFCKGPEEDHFFLDDVVRTIEDAPELRTSSKSLYCKALTSHFSFGDMGFHFEYGMDDSSSFGPNPSIVSPFVRQTLESYSSEQEGSWKHELYTMAAEVLQLWELPINIRLDVEMRVLDYQDSDDLWKQAVLLVS